MSGKILPACISALVLLSGIRTNAQDAAPEIKTWVQTSVEDFDRGTSENLVTTDLNGGELRLVHPMHLAVEEHEDETIPRFVSRDKDGRYLQTWTQADGVHAQRYDLHGEPIGALFLSTHLETPGDSVAYRSGGRTASHPDGGFLIVWECEVFRSGKRVPHPHRIYGQIYDRHGDPKGNSFRVDEGTGFTSYDPTVFVDGTGVFWVVWLEWIDTPRPGRPWQVFYLYAQRYTAGGEKMGGNFRLTEEKEPIHFPHSAVATAPDGGFVIASPKGLEDLLIQWFGANGLEAGDPVHIHAADFLSEDGEEHERVDGLDLAFDDQGNLLLVWQLEVCSLDADRGCHDALYGQYFGDRSPLRDPFPVKGRSAYNSLVDIDVFLGEEGVFMVSWLDRWNGSLHVNGWRWAPVEAGTFVSEVFDTGPAGADFEQLFWTAEHPSGATAVQFQVRTGVDPDDLG